jgi:hypothetical protein
MSRMDDARSDPSSAGAHPHGFAQTANTLAILLSLAILGTACGGGNAPQSPATSPPASGGQETTPPSTPETQTPPPATSSGTVSGTWNGVWESTKFPPASGVFQIVWTQSGDQISGTIQVASSTCVPNGTISGSLSGKTITFGTVQGAHTVTYTGAVSGVSMSGTYKAPDCGDDAGNWHASKA